MTEEKVNYFVKKTEKDIYEIAQQATAKKFINAIYSTFNKDKVKLNEFFIELTHCQNRLKFQNVIINYFKLVDLEKYLYSNGLDSFYVVTCEEEWIDYRGHFLYLLSSSNLDEKLL